MFTFNIIKKTVLTVALLGMVIPAHAGLYDAGASMWKNFTDKFVANSIVQRVRKYPYIFSALAICAIGTAVAAAYCKKRQQVSKKVLNVPAHSDDSDDEDLFGVVFHL